MTVIAVAATATKMLMPTNGHHLAGMTINPTNWLMLFGSYARAFRAPTMGEMYNDSKHFSIGRFYTNYWVPNPNLRPETNETQEYGFGLRFDDLMLSNDAPNLKPATLIPKRRITSPRPSISRRRQLCRITSRTPKSGAGM